MELKCDVLHNLLGYSSFWEATFTLFKLSNSYVFDLIATFSHVVAIDGSLHVRLFCYICSKNG